MNHSCQTLTLLLMLGIECAPTFAADRAKVTELVAASRVYIPAAGAYKEAVATALANKPPKRRACYLDIADDTFLNAAVDYLSKKLTDADIAQGLAFYATPLGKKIAARLSPNRGDSPPMGLEQADYDAQVAFAATRAGGELLAPSNLVRSDEMAQKTTRLFEAKMKECDAIME